MYLLIVNLYETTLHQMLFLALAVCQRDNLTKCSWNYPSAAFALVRSHHCVSFPTPSLPVREDCAIISLYATIYQRECCLLVNIALQ